MWATVGKAPLQRNVAEHPCPAPWLSWGKLALLAPLAQFRLACIAHLKLQTKPQLGGFLPGENKVISDTREGSPNPSWSSPTPWLILSRRWVLIDLQS